MTNFDPGPGRVKLTRLMRSLGHDGVLHMRTSGGSDAAHDIPRPEGKHMSASAPVPTRKEIQITGIRKYVAECVTEIGGTKCGARSNVWDSARHLDVWIRAHADECEHRKFVKLSEEPANVCSTPAKGQQ
ncbi:hypothetical protein ACH4GK_09750 [Streptomyces rimosus]|uniref:hypothetical protein n=1 Tax=Streptomyces rimosus TaxID=1927 RepID=UPI0004CC100D|nr:hypothetical protein [Streptomyces rimosus]